MSKKSTISLPLSLSPSLSLSLNCFDCAFQRYEEDVDARGQAADVRLCKGYKKHTHTHTHPFYRTFGLNDLIHDVLAVSQALSHFLHFFRR